MSHLTGENTELRNGMGRLTADVARLNMEVSGLCQGIEAEKEKYRRLWRGFYNQEVVTIKGILLFSTYGIY